VSDEWEPSPELVAQLVEEADDLDRYVAHYNSPKERAKRRRQELAATRRAEKYRRDDQAKKAKRRVAQIEAVKSALRNAGMEMSVDACGCCDGPHVRFVLNGEVIADESGFRFDTSKDGEE
jgi:hypothetical protein